MAKYRLVKRGKPGDKTGASMKWYATPVSEKAQSAVMTTRAATENTTTGPTELDGACYILRRYCENQLLQGHIATIPYFGTLRVTFKSEGVEDINTFNAGQMIHDPRIIFTPSKEFREAVINKITFDNAGVINDGIFYGSVKSYLEATGGGTSSGGGGTSSGSGGDDGNNPL